MKQGMYGRMMMKYESAGSHKSTVREIQQYAAEDMEGREALLHDIFGKVGKMYGSLHRLQQLLENMYLSETAPVLI